MFFLNNKADGTYCTIIMGRKLSSGRPTGSYGGEKGATINGCQNSSGNDKKPGSFLNSFAIEMKQRCGTDPDLMLYA
jgi:hypothetical protein